MKDMMKNMLSDDLAEGITLYLDVENNEFVLNDITLN